jgi:hypothetical protein
MELSMCLELSLEMFVFISFRFNGVSLSFISGFGSASFSLISGSFMGRGFTGFSLLSSNKV